MPRSGASVKACIGSGPRRLTGLTTWVGRTPQAAEGPSGGVRSRRCLGHWPRLAMGGLVGGQVVSERCAAGFQVFTELLLRADLVLGSWKSGRWGLHLSEAPGTSPRPGAAGPRSVVMSSTLCICGRMAISSRLWKRHLSLDIGRTLNSVSRVYTVESVLGAHQAERESHRAPTAAVC